MRPRTRADRKDLMLDPSVFLAPRSFGALTGMLEARPPTEPLFVPETFRTALAEGGLHPELDRYFGVPRQAGTLGGLDEEQEPPELRALPPTPPTSQIPSWLSEQGIRTYKPSPQDLALASEHGTLDVAELMAARYPWPVGRILYEEWLFLQSHSWLASRRKWVFTRFVWAGGVAVEVGRRGYDAALQRARNEIPELLTRQGAKRVGRFVAQTGSKAATGAILAMGGVYEAAITGLVGKGVEIGVNRIFLLIDP
jgi:hypothetical protein